MNISPLLWLFIGLSLFFCNWCDAGVAEDSGVKLYQDSRMVLDSFEELGLQFENLIESKSSRHWKSNKKLLADALKSDIASNQNDLRRYGKYLGKPRYFNPDWITSNKARFGLSGVVLRPDVRNAQQSECGKMRLIYRLYYYIRDASGISDSSDLPMTAALEYPIKKSKDDNCISVVDRIRSYISKPPTVNLELIFSQIAGNKFIPEKLEYNFQINRFPGDYSLNFSDQSHYGLGVMEFDKHFVLQKIALENTPDVTLLEENASLKAELWKFLSGKTEVDQVRAGHSFRLPTKFLAEKAVAVTPYGSYRYRNRPYTRLFEGDEWKWINHSSFAKGEYLRRLDTLSCGGCHGSRSIAGFHFLGQVSETKTYFNAMQSPFSAYFLGIQAWRQGLVNREQPVESPPNWPPKPDVDRTPLGLGSACGLHGNFKNWKCRPGMVCEGGAPKGNLVQFGQCLPNYRPRPIGGVCDAGTLRSSPEMPLKDRFFQGKNQYCPSQYICAKSQNGFPGGFCTSSCKDIGAKRTDILGDKICFDVPALGKFTECLEKGSKFELCLKRYTSRAWMPACRSQADCRNDYLCAKVDDSIGICSPFYLLHQLTVENHRI